MKVLLCASKPRMKGRSPVGLPPSPAPKVMPGTRRSASCRLSMPVCSSRPCGMIEIDLGVSTSSAVNLEEAGLNQLPRTWTWSRSTAASGPGPASAGASARTDREKAARVAVARTEAPGRTDEWREAGCLRDVMWDTGGSFVEVWARTAHDACPRGGDALLPQAATLR